MSRSSFPSSFQTFEVAIWITMYEVSRLGNYYVRAQTQTDLRTPDRLMPPLQPGKSYLKSCPPFSLLSSLPSFVLSFSLFLCPSFLFTFLFIYLSLSFLFSSLHPSLFLILPLIVFILVPQLNSTQLNSNSNPNAISTPTQLNSTPTHTRIKEQINKQTNALR